MKKKDHKNQDQNTIKATSSNRRRPHWRSFLKISSYGVLGLTFLLFIFWQLLIFFPDPLATGETWDWSVVVKDRNKIVLKEFLAPKEVRRQDKPLADFSPNLINAVLAGEDKRFYQHLGVDPLAVARAVWLNIKSGEIKSGASTITMQLARLSKGLNPGPRTFSRKLKELWWALLIERHHSKDEILAEYLNRAPCGNLTEGFNAASLVYLNKPAQTLSPAEAAFLAGLPPSPGALNPYKDPRPALKNRKTILRRMAQNGTLKKDELARALDEPLALNYGRTPFNAPHFVNYLKNILGSKPAPEIITTLDLPLQQKIEKMVARATTEYAQKGLNQAAVVVMSIPDGEILAWVGSADFFNEDGGQNDGVIAQRQPGSALKPFIYGLAFETGILTPASLIEDRASDYTLRHGSFSPSNYSGTFHGPVSARLALASSLNIPAVKVIDRLTVKATLNKLNDFGLSSLSQDAEYYGLGLALGGGEVSLLNLTKAYAALARGGLWQDIVLFRQPAPEKMMPKEVLSPGASFLVSNILADDGARATGFGQRSVLATPYPSSVKTGTSKNFRDNWCVGYTSNFVVGVWAGNFEANPMDKVSGVTGAGYLWREISDILTESYKEEKPNKPHPGVVQLSVCSLTGLLAGTHCPNQRLEYFLVSHAPQKVCRTQDMTLEALGVSVPVLGLNKNFHLIRPLDGELYALDPGLNKDYQHLKALVQTGAGIDELVWQLNGKIIKREKINGAGRYSTLIPMQKGQMDVSVYGYQKGQEKEKDQARLKVK